MIIWKLLLPRNKYGISVKYGKLGAHKVANWLSKLLGRGGSEVSAKPLYEIVMQRALLPVLYESGLADDTFDGRF